MVTARDISAYLDMLFPPSLSESWDNDGLSVDPCPFADVKTAAVALDLTSEVLDWAESIGAGCVVTHHPLIFRPLSSLRADDSVGKRVIRCIKSGIAAVSCHTRLDSAEGGVNDCLAAAAGITGAFAFLPFGRVGDLPSPMPPAEFAALLERALRARCLFRHPPGQPRRTRQRRRQGLCERGLPDRRRYLSDRRGKPLRGHRCRRIRHQSFHRHSSRHRGGGASLHRPKAFGAVRGA